MFCEVSKQRRFLTKTPSQTHDILVPLHMESDSCDRSGVGINRPEKLRVFSFAVKEKFF